jgi:hypothetical protein
MGTLDSLDTSHHSSVLLYNNSPVFLLSLEKLLCLLL